MLSFSSLWEKVLECHQGCERDSENNKNKRIKAGMTCGTKAVHWASFVSESFKEYFYRNLRFRKLQDVVKIDGSLFGRRVKFQRKHIQD